MVSRVGSMGLLLFVFIMIVPWDWAQWFFLFVGFAIVFRVVAWLIDVRTS